MSSNSAHFSPNHACRSCPCFSDCFKICHCGRRCEILTSMTTRNPIRRFARCKRFASGGGCDYFSWVDDELCEKVRSMAVALVVKNQSLTEQVTVMEKAREDVEVERVELEKKLGSMQEERDVAISDVERLKGKNIALKMDIRGYKNRERAIIWALLFLLMVVAIRLGIGGGNVVGY